MFKIINIAVFKIAYIDYLFIIHYNKNNGGISILNNITIYIYIVKIFFISICTYYTFTKIINMKPFFNAKLFVICVLSILISVICGVFKYELGTLVSFLLLILCLSIIYWISIKSTLIYSIIFTIISLSINYIIFFIALTISFFPSIILSITNDYLNLALTIILHLIMLILLFKIRKWIFIFG